MSKIKLGIQAHSVREAFAEDPIGTMKKIKAMGYTGVEIAMGSIKKFRIIAGIFLYRIFS